MGVAPGAAVIRGRRGGARLGVFVLLVACSGAGPAELPASPAPGTDLPPAPSAPLLTGPEPGAVVTAWIVAGAGAAPASAVVSAPPRASGQSTPDRRPAESTLSGLPPFSDTVFWGVVEALVLMALVAGIVVGSRRTARRRKGR